MKKFNVLALCAIAAGIFISCEKNEPFNEAQTEITSEISDEHKVALIAAGVNPEGAVYSTQKLLGDVTIKGIIAGGPGANNDIILETSKLKEMALQTVANGNKQYRTNNLVSQNKVITIIGFTGGSQGLSSFEQNVLQQSIDEYNALPGVNISFDLTFGTNWQDKDMVVFDNTVNNPGSSGGRAGFPSGGDPFQFVQFYGLDGASYNVYESIIKHEIGHSIGFRHTDYARRKCDGSNEGSSGIGAILVDGTPSENRWGFPGIDSNSIMISCVQGPVDGEFTSADVRALQEMY